MFKSSIKVLLVAIGLLVAVGLFLDNGFTVSSSILINSSTKEIHFYVNDLKKWPRWSPWLESGEKFNVKYGVVTSGIGATQSWQDSNGKGKLNITASSPDNGIAYDMFFGNDKLPTISAIEYEIEADGMTRVTWRIRGQIDLPILGGYIALFIENKISSMYHKGLTNLKNVVERDLSNQP